MADLTKKIIQSVLLTGIGGIFVVAGFLKVMNPAAFTIDIDHYQILPWPLAVIVALYLPWLELMAAAALLLKEFRVAALGLMLAMSGFFLMGMISALSRGLNIDCGCFSGSGGHLSSAILRDLGIIAGLIACLWLEKKRNAWDGTRVGDNRAPGRVPSVK